MTRADRAAPDVRSRASRGRWRHTAVVAAASLALVVGMANAASADNFGSQGRPGTGATNSGVWLTEDRAFSVGYRNLEASTSDAMADAIEGSYQPTDLEVSHGSASSCPDRTFDTCVYDSDYGDNGLLGWNACAGTIRDAHPAQRCSLTWIKINLHYAGADTMRVACHELGHAVGLRHSLELGSCMEEGWGFDTLTAHDQSHINETY